MKITGFVKGFLYYNNLISDSGFIKRDIYTRTDIIQNISCTDQYISIIKTYFVNKFNIHYDQITFNCHTITNDKGVLYTKRDIQLFI